MPEGDSVATNALALRPLLVGNEVIDVYATKGSVRVNVSRIRGKTVGAVRTFGKNLVIDVDDGFSILVHHGMTGKWLVLPSDRRVAGAASLALSTTVGHAVCSGAPRVEVGRTPAIDKSLERLGPDLLMAPFPVDEVVRRARAGGRRTLSDVLLDQTVAAGLGNVYKSELAFLAAIHPTTPVDEIDDETLVSIYEKGAKLLAANVGPGARTTTGDRGRGRESWVYGRAGLGCRRCATRIESEIEGERVTYWCPRCQAPEDRVGPVS